MAALALLDVTNRDKRRLLREGKGPKGVEDGMSLLRAVQALSARIVFLPESGYPSSLRESSDPPFFLCVRGFLPKGKMVAFSGNPKPTNVGFSQAFLLGSCLSRDGWFMMGTKGGESEHAVRLGAMLAGRRWGTLLSHGLSHAPLPQWGETQYSPFLPSKRENNDTRRTTLALLPLFAEYVVVGEASLYSDSYKLASDALDGGREVCLLAHSFQGGDRCGGSVRLRRDGCPLLEWHALINGFVIG